MLMLGGGGGSTAVALLASHLSAVALDSVKLDAEVVRQYIS